MCVCVCLGAYEGLVVVNQLKYGKRRLHVFLFQLFMLFYGCRKLNKHITSGIERKGRIYSKLCGILSMISGWWIPRVYCMLPHGASHLHQITMWVVLC